MAGILKTSCLGEIRGKTANGVSQYLGIPYATLQNPFAEAELVCVREENTILDATKDGPTAFSPPDGFDLELSHIQQTLPKKDLAQSGVDCLNLNITVPASATAESKLPVFLFIHGGGLMLGANSWPQNDYSRLVELSVEKKLPIVAVALNYRLGAFGFLTSKELRDAGYKANNGLHDQRLAMRWVQKHIRDFGGDPDNVTLAGESAGGASVTYHIQGDEPLFRRAIAMSGTYFVAQALPFEVHEQNYERAMAALGLSDLSPEERIKALVQMPGPEIVEKLPPPVLMTAPAIDDCYVKSAVTYSQTMDSNANMSEARKVCKDLLIGNIHLDASIIGVLMPHLKHGCAKKFTQAVRSVLASRPLEAQRVLDEYNVTEDAQDADAFEGVLNFINDILFFAPVLAFARGWTGRAYVYYFNEPNPWEGPLKGTSTHILDLAYMFQNFREFLTPEQQALGVALAEDVFKFCHGVAPWPAVKEDNTLSDGFTARVYGPSNKTVATTVTEPFGEASFRRSVFFDVEDKVSLDEFVKVFLTLVS